MKSSTTTILLILIAIFPVILKAADTTKVDVNLDMKHSVGGVSEFDREKFITLHASLLESDWNGEADKLEYVLNTLDVYLGRDNGGINWWLSQFPEDKNHPGYVDSTKVISRGITQRNSYKNNTERNKYDSKADIMVGGQTHAIWPGRKSGWQFADALATGDYMARYLNEFHRELSDENKNNGHPRPRFLEVLNEPLYELIDDPKIPENEKSTPIEIFRYHRDVAKGVKNLNPGTMVGGYTAAFPVFDENNFQRWEDRMKLFIDTAGTEMDFYSIHLYDFNRHWHTGNKSHIHYKGSRTEATFDMIEQYGMLKYGEVKPMIISEYAGRDHTMENKPWFPERDWMVMKAISPLLMSFIDRPDNILKTIPFIVNRAEWGRSDDGIPYGPRLQRQRFEDPNDSGDDWVFTELIKFYELWSGVRGTRVDMWSGNPDVKTAAYVIGPKAHLIFSNLSFDRQTVDLNLHGLGGNRIKDIQIKQLYANNDIPILETTNPASLEQLVLESEATAIVEITFENIVNISERSNEVKHYATSYLKEIKANQSIDFQLEGVVKAFFGNGQLRVAFGREHSKSKKPIVSFNGTKLNVTDNFSGESQEGREGFFGLLEIPVPFDIIEENNTVSVTFPDDGGHVSTVTLRTFIYSREVNRSDSVQSVSLYPSSVEMGVSQERILTATILPANANDTRLTWISSEEDIVTVDTEGKITGKAVGTATITATSLDGGFTATCEVKVQTDRVTVEVDTVIVLPVSAELIVNENIQLSYEIFPIDADDKMIVWSSGSERIATVNSSGLVTAKADGVADIIASANNGEIGISKITSKIKVPGSVSLDNISKYKNTTYYVGEEMDVKANFRTTTGTTVGSKGVKFWLRELKSNWAVVKDYIAYDASQADKVEGEARATISLDGVIPTSELPNGNFYWLWVTFEGSDGDGITTQFGASPIKIERTTSIEKLNNPGIKIYPNPASNKIFIQSDFDYSKVTFYNITGSLAFSKNTSEKSVDISKLSDGVYIAEISGKKKIAKIKVLIQH